MTVQGNDIDSDLNFDVDLTAPDIEALKEGFNKHGVKGTDDRVEFIFEAMQPGTRNGVAITEDFLKKVASNFDSEVPLMKFHNKRNLSVGNITDVWFSDGALRLKGYTPKTGAETHEEVAKRFTYDPPQIQNGSVGFGMNYEMAENDDGKPLLVDGEMQEFSLTHFPGGYDEETGGLKAQFEQAYQQYKADTGDEASEGSVSGAESADFSLETDELFTTDTMTFNRIEFGDLPEDLPEEVAEFIESVEAQHKENAEFIQNVVDDRDEYEEELGEFKAEFAEDLAGRDEVPLQADELKDFALDRLYQMEEDTRPETDEDFEADEGGQDEQGQDFGSKEQKSGDQTKEFAEEEAKAGLDQIGGIVVE